MSLYKRGRIWWTKFSVGGEVYYRSTRTRDKRAAEEVARGIRRHEERRRAGLVDPREAHGARPLSEHLKGFRSTLAARGVTKHHLDDRMRCLKAFKADTGATRLGDLDLATASDWIEGIARTGLSARSVNRRIQALRQFGRWLHQTQRTGFDPFRQLGMRNESEDRRRVRRSLSPQEFARLLNSAFRRPLETAREQRVRAGVSASEEKRLRRLGGTRALVYLLAAGTGLRRSELARLRWCDLDLDRALLTVPASSAKSRREQFVDLHGHLMEALAAFRPEDAEATDTVVPRGSFPNIKTFTKDLEGAGIPKVDDTGRVVDLHALRTSFISWCAANNEHPRVAQALARHSSMKTTMSHYVDLRLMDTRGAVERLPMPRLAADGKLSPILSPSSDPSLPVAASLRNEGGVGDAIPSALSPEFGGCTVLSVNGSRERGARFA